ncbi:Myblike DNAbinding domain-containing protein [Entomortierella chlamydospora]|uniref:Myblike DNAbinding domain-containing protein n=1 Tax=Entomortierella chlamydospora TaxID=101097 RepID=A0A9P6MWF1_9FUNG|nr:Myblike DNAbinding domain-containing protein [Entomortierella chlamydospora]KAG0015256.1 Myblike DNAbinding domain-containing protein [Entomortierella chlamydospora]
MSASRDVRQLQRLFVRCTFTPVLGSPRHLKSSAISTSTRPQNVFSVNTFNLSHGAQTQQRRFATKTASLKPALASSPVAETAAESTQPWTKDDDRMLATLRRKKTDLAQIQIYMPHQPIAAIEAHMKQLDERKPTFQRWTLQEDELLAKAVEELGTSNWNEISDLYFSPSTAHTSTTKTHRRSPRSCQIRWNFLHAGSVSGASSSTYRTGAWTADELELFHELVNPSPTPESPNNWEEISLAMGTRSAIQCHSQFKTVMHTGTKGKWTVEEVNRLLEARELYGGDWQKVAKHVGTRAPGQVRQKWNQFSEDVLRRLQAKRQRVTE